MSNTRRARLGVLQLEDRTVPSTVTVVRTEDAVEGGAAGNLRFTRTGDTSQELTVYYAIGGNATWGDDYTPFTGTPGVLTFIAGEEVLNLAVVALDDGVADPDEEVSIFLQDGPGYTLDALPSATLTIRDSSTGVIAGRAWEDDGNGVQDDGEPGLSDVTVFLLRGLDVVGETTTDADGSYRFTGLDPGSDYQVRFVPLDSDGATPTAYNASGDDTTDSDLDPGIGLTDPIAVAAGQVAGSVDGGFILAAPAAPTVGISFPLKESVYYLQLKMTTASGQMYDFGPQLVQGYTSKDARALVEALLRERNWDVTPRAETRLVINGFRPAGGMLDRVADVTYTIYKTDQYPSPLVAGVGGATATPDDGATPRPAPAPGNSRGVFLSFPPGGLALRLEFVMDTVGGVNSTSGVVQINELTGAASRDKVRDALPTDWVVEDLGDAGLLIKGRLNFFGFLDPVSSLTVKYRGLGLGGAVGTANVFVTDFGGATGQRVPF